MGCGGYDQLFFETSLEKWEKNKRLPHQDSIKPPALDPSDPNQIHSMGVASSPTLEAPGEREREEPSINPLLVHAGLATHAKVAPSLSQLGIVTAPHPMDI